MRFLASSLSLTFLSSLLLLLLSPISAQYTTCIQQGYNLTSLTGSDLFYTGTGNAAGTGSVYNWAIRPCGVVTTTGYCNGEFCQGGTIVSNSNFSAVGNGPIWAQVNTNGQQGIAQLLQDGDVCSVITADREGTIQYLCNPSATPPYISSILELSTCHYQAIVQTAVVCPAANLGYTTAVGTSILASASNLQCGGGIYNLAALNASDFSGVINSTTGGTNYNFVIRLCGNVSSTTACSGTPFTSICQINVNTPTAGNVLASYNPLVSAVVWTYNGNGLSQIVQDGAGCANQNRFTNITFVCSSTATTPVIVSEVESPTCHYTLIVQTNAVCGTPFLSLPPVATSTGAAGPSSTGVFVPTPLTATWVAASSGVLPQKTYPSCTYDIHGATNTPVMWYIMGETAMVSTSPTTDGYYSVDGFYNTTNVVHLTATTTNAGVAIAPRRAASVVYLNNGNLVLMAGKTTGNAYLQAVFVSGNLGQNWTDVTPTTIWSARSDASVCAMPMTSTIFLAAGQGAAGSLNDVWISQDGQGTVWTQVTAAGPFLGSQSAPCVGLYDSSVVSASYSSPYSTIIQLLNNGSYLTTTNLGYTYSPVLTGPWAAANYINLIADRDNYVYVVGGQNELSNAIYVSQDKGNTWRTVGALNSFQLGGEFWQEASTTCSAMQVVQSGGVYYKQLAIYGGTILLNTSASATVVYESIHGTLNVPYKSIYQAPPFSCVQQGYDLSSLSTADLFYTGTGNAAGTGTMYNWAIRPCGVVSTAGYCVGGEFCQGTTVVSAANVSAQNVGNGPIWAQVNTNGQQGVAQLLQDGTACSAITADREGTIQFLCNPTALAPYISSILELSTCHYQAIVQTAVVCPVANLGYSSNVGTSILQTTAGAQCGGGVYDLTAINSQDFFTNVNSTTGGTNYTFVVRVCGTVSSTTACSGTALTSVCQFNVNTPTAGNILATYNPTVSPVVWTYTGNGLSQIVQDGAGCAVSNQNRFTNITFVCSSTAATPVVLSEVESPSCHYTIIVATNAVCGTPFAVPKLASSSAGVVVSTAAPTPTSTPVGPTPTSTPSPAATSTPPSVTSSAGSFNTPATSPVPTSPVSSTAAAPASGGGGGGSSGLSNGAIAGIVIGSVVGALLCLALLLVVFCRGSRRGEKQTTIHSNTEGQYDPHSDLHSSEVEMR